jgi:hypothetical protein
VNTGSLLNLAAKNVYTGVSNTMAPAVFDERPDDVDRHPERVDGVPELVS